MKKTLLMAILIVMSLFLTDCNLQNVSAANRDRFFLEIQVPEVPNGLRPIFRNNNNRNKNKNKNNKNKKNKKNNKNNKNSKNSKNTEDKPVEKAT